MGEVYKARDTRLDRTVAIKVLPQHLSSSAEGRQRFEREAKTISALSHPHICALYDVGREDETEYLVMEYLEGETLAERLAKGPMPLDQTLRYGTQIADALDRAHRQDIVHRDLKPANVMLTKSGVKLLDFGLAKAIAPAAQPAALTSLPTAMGNPNITQEGTILGTFQYMAPEQLEGREADARSDIFAFGALLYEMATGKKAFDGNSRASLISAILRDNPKPISQLQPMAPASLDRLVRKSLAKDPEDRWQSARDLASELEWIREGGSQSEPSVTKVHTKREAAAWLIAALFAAAIVTLLMVESRARRPNLDGAFRWEVVPPESSVLETLNPVGTFFSLSPDGRMLAFVARSSNTRNSRLFVRALDSLVAQPVGGSEGDVSSPFWSPDGAFLAFFADGKLKKIALSGGPAITICEAPQGATGTWGTDGTIIFSEWGSEPAIGFLRRVSSSGGEPTVASRLDVSRREHWHQWPIFLPDGRHFLYLSWYGDAWPKGGRGIFLGTLGSLDARLVTTADSEFAYSPPGFLFFAREGALFAQRFDPDSATVQGEPRMIASAIQTYRPTGVASLSAAQRAPIIAVYAGATTSNLVWVDRTGKEVGTLGSDRYFSSRSLRLSPDGKRFVFALFDPHLGTTDLWVKDLERATSTRVTFDPWSEFSPVWSSDGHWLFFSGDQGGQPPDLFRVSLTDLKTEPLLRTQNPKEASDVSPDGRFLLYDDGGIGHRDIWVLPLTGEKKPFPFVASPFDETGARFSRDGHYVAYTSSESGRPEIYVRRFPAGPERWQVSRSGGDSPRWSRGGKEIFFMADGRVMAAPVRLDRSFESGAPAALFALGLAAYPDYEVSPDGRFILFSAGAHAPGIQIIANWASELKR
jgi:serine/threonine protein kinase